MSFWSFKGVFLEKFSIVILVIASHVSNPMRWTKHAACTGEVRHEYNNSGGKSDGKYHSGDLGVNGS
jgi:hypothetical protein